MGAEEVRGKMAKEIVSEAKTERRATVHPRSEGVEGDPVCADDRHSLGDATQRDGGWERLTWGRRLRYW